MEGLSIERNECTLRKFNCQLVAVGIDLRSSENNIYNIYLCIYTHILIYTYLNVY